MATESMTIHKGLVELKILKERIERSIAESTYCMTALSSAEKIDGIDISELEKTMLSSYNSVKDLIARRNKIKRAIVLSNVMTKITVCGEEMSVAEAIEMKNNGMVYYQKVIEKIRTQYLEATKKCQYDNDIVLGRKATDYVLGIYGQKDIKANPDEVERLKDGFITANTTVIVQGFDIQKAMKDIYKMIDNFNVDIDSELSRSNALTLITIE